MFLGAMVDLHDLSGDKGYLRAGAVVLDSVVQHLTNRTGGRSILQEPVGLKLQSAQCDSNHDPSAPSGGDLYSFKAVFFHQLPRFLRAAKDILTKAQLQAARKLVKNS